MYIPKWLCVSSLLLMATVLIGCARTARNTEGFAINDSATVNAPFMDTWQTAKEVLREKGYDIYTRDKRGVFVAFTRMKRSVLLVPKRTKYTIVLQAASDSSTEVTIESIKQVFGVTLLTYPGWHDRPATDHTAAQQILEAIQAKVAGAAPAPAESASKPS